MTQYTTIEGEWLCSYHCLFKHSAANTVGFQHENVMLHVCTIVCSAMQPSDNLKFFVFSFCWQVVDRALVKYLDQTCPRMCFFQIIVPNQGIILCWSCIARVVWMVRVFCKFQWMLTIHGLRCIDYTGGKFVGINS